MSADLRAKVEALRDNAEHARFMASGTPERAIECANATGRLEALDQVLALLDAEAPQEPPTEHHPDCDLMFYTRHVGQAEADAILRAMGDIKAGRMKSLEQIDAEYQREAPQEPPKHTFLCIESVGLYNDDCPACKFDAALPVTPTWQSIETCPDDGAPVLLYHQHPHTGQPVIECRPFAIIGSGGARSCHAWATHWMPLPMPPEESR